MSIQNKREIDDTNSCKCCYVLLFFSGIITILCLLPIVIMYGINKDTYDTDNCDKYSNMLILLELIKYVSYVLITLLTPCLGICSNLFKILIIFASVFLFIIQNTYFYQNLNCDYNDPILEYVLLSILILGYLQFVLYIMFIYGCVKFPRIIKNTYINTSQLSIEIV